MVKLESMWVFPWFVCIIRRGHWSWLGLRFGGLCSLNGKRNSTVSMENISNSSSNTFFFFFDTIHFPLSPLSSFLSLYISCVQEQNCHQTHLWEQSPPSFTQLCVAATQTLYGERNSGNFVKLLPGIGWICGCFERQKGLSSITVWLILTDILSNSDSAVAANNIQTGTKSQRCLIHKGEKNVGSIISCVLKHIHTFSS